MIVSRLVEYYVNELINMTHISTAQRQTQNVLGVDFIKLDGLLESSVQKVNNLDLITKILQKREFLTI